MGRTPTMLLEVFEGKWRYNFEFRMQMVVKKLPSCLKSFWQTHAEKHFSRGFFDRIHAKFYYRKKHSWYERTYWKWYDDNDYYRPNGILSEGKEHLFIKERIVLEHIDSDGKILDLWCGNGLLLKLIQKKSPFPLTPYGIDFLEKSILQAKTLFQEYRENFQVKNIAEFQSENTFNYILLAPGYVRLNDFETTIKYCISRLTSRWKLFIISPDDTIAEFQKRLPLLENIVGKSLTPVTKNGITYVLLKK